MLRIAICNSDNEQLKMLFDTAMICLDSLGIQCELTSHKSTLKPSQQLMGDKNYYDILILDGTDLSCLELAQQLRSSNLIPALIFTAPEPSAVHALLPYRPSALITDCGDDALIIGSIRQCCNEQLRHQSFFTVKNKSSLLRISFDEISFFESRQRLAIVHTARQTVEFYAKLSEVMNSLPPQDFVRCHQSYIVNLQKVSRLDKHNRCFILTSGLPIEISKSNYAPAVAQYEAYTNR